MDIKKILDFVKSLPVWSRVCLVVAAALAAIAVLCTSCARSSMLFKGTGDVEYIFKGTNGPSLPSEK